MLLFKKLYISNSWDAGDGFAFLFSFEQVGLQRWIDDYKWVWVLTFRILWWYNIISIHWYPEGVDAWKNQDRE